MSDAIVIASGRSVWTDLAAIERVAVRPTWFAINELIIFSPHVDHAVSHHWDKVPHWVALRSYSEGRADRERTITTHTTFHEQGTKNNPPGIDRVWRQFRGGGSSSLLAVRIALALGHPRVFVAGVPLDNGGYVWSDPRERNAPRTIGDYARYRGAWMDHHAELKGRVFAPSGWLHERHGFPVAEAVSA